jgi:hypothetical protein
MSSTPSWIRTVQAFGEQGEEWLRGYLPYMAISQRTHDSVLLLRRHEVTAAREVLEEVHADLDRLDGLPPSVHYVLMQWYKAASAYLCYCEADYEQAIHLLDESRKAVEAAVSLDRFLLPLSFQCVDFVQQYARINRRRCDWDEMVRCLRRLRAIYADEEPFCSFSGGEPVYISTLCEHYRSLSLADAEKKAVLLLAEEPYRCQLYQEAVFNICIQPELVIPY